MNPTHHFLQGPIARDYRDILESAPALETATKATTGKNCSGPKICPKPNTGKNCSAPKICEKAITGKNCSAPHVCQKTTTGKNCSAPKVCPKASADAFQPSVPGWSLPPTPPSA